MYVFRRFLKKDFLTPYISGNVFLLLFFSLPLMSICHLISSLMSCFMVFLFSFKFSDSVIYFVKIVFDKVSLLPEYFNFSSSFECYVSSLHVFLLLVGGGLSFIWGRIAL